MTNLTKGSQNIGNKIKGHMVDQGWPQEKREKLWTATNQGSKQVFATIPVSLIKSSKNIRRGEDEQQINELAKSIQTDGLIQNPVVCLEKNDAGAIHFVMVAGHRRLSAFKVLGRQEIDCAIKIFSSESERLVSSFIENDVRSNMDVFDTALAYQKMKDSGLSSNEIAKRTNKDISSINRFLKFNTWSDDLVNKIRIMEIKPALRDLFLLLTFKQDEIFKKLDQLANLKSKKRPKAAPNSLRVPAHEKRYEKIKDIISKYDFDEDQLGIFSKVLKEADIIRKAL